MIMLGVFGWGGHQFMTVAHRFADASLLTPFGYSFIFYLTAWSYILFGHVPDQLTVTGALSSSSYRGWSSGSASCNSSGRDAVRHRSRFDR